MYEAATAGEASTPSRLAVTAAGSGYSGLILRNGHSMAIDRESIRDFAGIDVVVAHTVAGTDRRSVRQAIRAHRAEIPVLIVRGGTVPVNRFTVETPTVDVLAGAMRGDGDVNHVMARAADDNDVYVEFDLGPVLRKSGGERVRHIGALRKLQDLVTDAGGEHVVTAGGRSHLHIRGPRELEAVGERIGLGAAFVIAGLENWAELVADNRRRQADDWVAPGIRAGGDDDPIDEDSA